MASRSKGRILLVDDTPASIGVVRTTLEEEGYVVFVATSGAKAIRRAQLAIPDLILLDILMPGMDGYETCRRLKADEATREIPVIFMSALTESFDKVKGFETGAVDYITKPFQHAEVLARVATHVSLARMHKRLEERNSRLQLEIMERKQAEKELQQSHDELSQALSELERTQAQMLQSEKMASIGQLAAGVAHEINNPTGFISSNLGTLADYQKDLNGLIKQYRTLTTNIKDTISDENLPTFITEQLERIVTLEDKVDIDFIQHDILDLIKESREGTDRIKKIVTDLKDFVHPGEDEVQYADINKGIESTLNVVWNELKYKAEVTKDFGDLPLVKCYPRQLNQVFMNILVNAAYAIKEQGEINIRTEANDDGYVEIRIIDNGVGIPKENLSKIFDPFFTTRDVGQGTGLGLNVAYNIVKKHNGTIDVESTLGGGTTFIIRIPFQ